jgi:choline dehydrogenase-like flavoprotein
MKELGVPFREDTNAPKPASFITKLRTTVTGDGRRCATSSFLTGKDLEERRNLKVCLGSVVQRIDLDDKNEVQGVFVENEKDSGVTYYVKAREIILSGGAIASPQLLMLRYNLRISNLIAVELDQSNNCKNLALHVISTCHQSEPSSYPLQPHYR